MKTRFMLGVVLCAWCANVFAEGECALYEAHTHNPVHGGSVSVVQSLSDECEWVMTASPATGYSFDGWNDGVMTNPRTITIDPTQSTITYTATFHPVTYDNPATGGTVKAEPVDNSCDWIVTATPTAGYAFLKWDDGTINNPRTVTGAEITAKASYTATFIEADAAIDGWTADNKVVVRTKNVNIGSSTATVYTAGTQRATDLELTRQDAGYWSWSIPASLNTYAGTPLKIVFYCSGNPVSVIDTVVPYVVTSDANISALAIPETSDVQVVSGTLTMDATSSTIAALDIYPNAKAVVPANKDLAVSAIYMRANAMNGTYPQLVANGDIANTSGKIYYDYELDYNQYYPLAVPYTVLCSDIFTHTGKQASFEIQWYDGAARAGSGAGWKVLDDQAVGAQLNAGQGYIVFAVPYKWNGTRQSRVTVRFPMSADLSAGEVEKRKAVSLYNGTKPADCNWNFLGNPYMADYTTNDSSLMMQGHYIESGTDDYSYVNDGVRYVTTSDDGFRTYTQRRAADGVVIRPFNPFFIQAAEAGNLTFSLSNRAVQSAPQRVRVAAMPKEIAFGLVLHDGKSTDRTGMLYGEAFSDEYEINADLVKLSGSESVLEFYSLSDNEKRAYNALSVNDMARPVTLGFRNAMVGEMTIAFDSEHYDAYPLSAVMLTDHETGMVVNLLDGEYRFSSNRSQNDTRFVLHAILAPQVATGLDNEIMNDPLRNGVYDLVGHRLEGDILPRGVYIIVENGQRRKVIIQ